MTTPLEFLGNAGPWRDAKKFVDAMRRYDSSLTDIQIEAHMHRENARRRPRHDRWSFQLLGMDILADNLTDMEAWAFLPKEWKRDLPLYPLDGGALIRSTDDGAAVKLQTAIAQHGMDKVNRRSLLVPAGLSKSYVWCKANGFIQEVADADVAIIRRTPILNLMFRNPHLSDGPMAIHRFERQSVEKFAFSNLTDVAAFERDIKRKPQWKGR